MSSQITQLFTNQTTAANSASFNCSPNDNRKNSVQGLQIIGTQDGATIAIQQFNAVETDETDDANWSDMTLTNAPTINSFFPISNAPDALKFRVAITNAGAATDITVNFLRQDS